MRAVLLTVGATLLSGCGGAVLNGLYFLETPRLVFVSQRFDHLEEWQWSYGPFGSTVYGGPLADYTYDIRDGYFISYNGPNFAMTQDLYPGHAEVVLTWQLWDSYGTGVEDNGFGHDFRIILDSNDSSEFDPRGPVVELKLFSFDVNYTHALRVRDEVDAAIDVAVAVNDPALPTDRGTLHVVFRLNSETPTITARALDEFGDAFLQVTHEVPGGWAEEVRFFVEAVGGYFESPDAYVEPRVIDSVLVLAPEADA